MTKKHRIWSVAGLAAAACLTVAALASCAGQNAASGSDKSAAAAPDVTAPQLLGVQDLTVAMNGVAYYRDGVSAVDDVDGPVAVEIDAGAVDLTVAGEYPVIYSAQDAAGNRVEQTATVTVVETITVDQGQDEQTEDEAPEEADGGASPSEVTQEDVDRLADEILARITNSGMSQREKAKAIFNYVNRHIKYVGKSDKSSWLIGAYVGLTRGRGDCYNYFACSKALLTRAGIPNVDLERVGGKSRHYWQLVNTGDGWYHFDACPHPTGYPMSGFMMTETQARTYTEQVKKARQNYYVYDYDACPVQVEGMPPEGWTPPAENPEESVTPPEGPAVPENPAGSQEPGTENPAGSQEPGTGNPAGSQGPGTENPVLSQDPITGEWPGGTPTDPPPDQSGAEEVPGGDASTEQQQPDQSGEEGGQLAA